MKKTYMNPTTKVVKIELTHMIALSTLGPTNATSGNLSRDRFAGFWDDEDDFDE